MLFSDSKDDNSSENKEESVRLPLMKLNNFESLNNIPDFTKEKKQEKRILKPPNLIPTLSETTCQSKNSSKKVNPQFTKNSLNNEEKKPKVPKTPFSNFSPIEYISPPPNLSKMNSTSRMLFCDESALKSTSSVFSKEERVNETVEKFFERSNFQNRKYVTPQIALKEKKAFGSCTVGKGMKNSAPFIPNENTLLSKQFFENFSRSNNENSSIKREVGVIECRKEDLTKFEIVEEKISEDGRTSLMIKNIPNKYTKEMIVDILDISFYQRYDFFYLPIDFKNRCNVGYAFINFLSTTDVQQFYESFNGKKWPKFNSEKICEIKYAKIQGLKALDRHFKEKRNESIKSNFGFVSPLNDVLGISKFPYEGNW